MTNYEIEEAMKAFLLAYNYQDVSYLEPKHLNILVNTLINNNAFQLVERNEVYGDIENVLIRYDANQWLNLNFDRFAQETKK